MPTPIFESTDRFVGTNDAGTVYQKLDGSRYLYPAFVGEPIPCLPGASICEVASLSPTFAADSLSIAEAGLAQTFNPEALALLSFAPTTGALRALQDASAYVPGGIVQLAEIRPDIAATANLQSQQVISQLYATTVRDPRDGKTDAEQLLDGYERSFTPERLAANQTNLAGAVRRVLMGIFGDGFGLDTITGINGPVNIGGFSLSEGNYGSQDINDIIYGGGSAAPPMSVSGGGGILDSILAAVPNLLVGLSRAGVIRGSVGQALAGNAGASPMAVAPQGGNMASNFSIGQLACSLFPGLCTMGGGIPLGDMTPQGPLLPGQMQGDQYVVPSMGGCGPRGPQIVNLATAPGLFRAGCNGLRTANRVIAEDLTGNRDLYVKVGRIASPSPRVIKRFAKRWAREAGLVAHERGRGGSRARRTYRRRRPR